MIGTQTEAIRSRRPAEPPLMIGPRTTGPLDDAQILIGSGIGDGQAQRLCSLRGGALNVLERCSVGGDQIELLIVSAMAIESVDRGSRCRGAEHDVDALPRVGICRDPMRSDRETIGVDEKGLAQRCGVAGSLLKK